MKARQRKRTVYRQHAYVCVLDWWIGDRGNGMTTGKNWSRHRNRPGMPRLKPSPKRYRGPWDRAYHKAYKEKKK